MSGEHRCTKPVDSVLIEFDFVCNLLSFGTTSPWSRARKTSSHVAVIVIGEDMPAILLSGRRLSRRSVGKFEGRGQIN
jgi:hypothetical protein